MRCVGVYACIRIYGDVCACLLVGLCMHACAHTHDPAPWLACVDGYCQHCCCVSWEGRHGLIVGDSGGGTGREGDSPRRHTPCMRRAPFFLYLPMSSLLFFPLPFLSLLFTSSSLFLLPHPFLLKMGRSLPCGSARPVVSSMLRAKGREVVTELELLPPEEGAVCGHFVSRLSPTGLGRHDPGSPPEAPPLPGLIPGRSWPTG